MSMNCEFKERIEDMSYEELTQLVQKYYNQKMPEINKIPYVGVEGEQCKYVFEELTALCPMTGLPDFYTVEVLAIPEEVIPELKSLKLYYNAYRNTPISHEHLCSKIYTDIFKTIDPQYLKVKLSVSIRGGIKTDIMIQSDEVV